MARFTAGLCALFVVACGAGGESDLQVNIGETSAETGSFSVETQATGSGFRLLVRDQAMREVFATPPGQRFVGAAQAESNVASSRGSFVFDERRTASCPEQSIDTLEMVSTRVEVRGRLSGPTCDIGYTLSFSVIDDVQLGFSLRFDDASWNRAELIADSVFDERIMGLGTQYSFSDLNGQQVPVWVQEQGIGRGLEPITGTLNLASPGSGGTPFTTYAPMPYYISSRMRGLSLENTEYSVFDFEDADSASIEVWASEMRGRIYAGQSPTALVEAHTRFTGRMQPLPAWSGRGAVVRVHGGSDAIRAKVLELEGAGVPLAGLWIEDWVGERDTISGTRLWWNWEHDRDLYEDWGDLLFELESAGIRPFIYFNPFITESDEKENRVRDMFSEAEAMGYLVLSPDTNEPVKIGQAGFDAGLLDLSNADARAWMKTIIRDQISLGAAGWMADFGEALPYDAVIASGDSPTFHNLYPVEWARLNAEAVAEAGRAGDIIHFHRSGYSQSPLHATLFWLGDQTVTWDAFDGFRTVVPGLISSGLSGYALNHADIGGYFSTDAGGVDLVRSRELLWRWIELAAFTPFYRNHETNRREMNYQIDDDPDTLAHFARFARVFAALATYRETLMAIAQNQGTPLIRHTWMAAPDDPEALLADAQFMLGGDIVIAPVLDPGANQVSVYLPDGDWVRLGQGSVDSGTLTVDAAIGDPAVFYRAGASFASDLESAFSEL